MVMPLNFILPAERYNRMRKIDLWIIQHTLFYLEHHSSLADQTSFITINLSGNSISNDDFQKKARRILADTRLPKEKIFFELTETAAVSNLDMTKKFMEDMRKEGYGFVLDDFGTGVSSFAYLKTLPVSLIKIDGTFVKNIATDETDKRLVKAINELSHAMNMKTIAEFVENEQILLHAKSLEIDYAQGYHLHKPEALEEVKTQ